MIAEVKIEKMLTTMGCLKYSSTALLLNDARLIP